MCPAPAAAPGLAPRPAPTSAPPQCRPCACKPTSSAATPSSWRLRGTRKTCSWWVWGLARVHVAHACTPGTDAGAPGSHAAWIRKPTEQCLMAGVGAVLWARQACHGSMPCLAAAGRRHPGCVRVLPARAAGGHPGAGGRPAGRDRRQAGGGATMLSSRMSRHACRHAFATHALLLASVFGLEQAVDLWQASTGHGPAAAGQEGGDGEQQAQQREQQPAAAADSPELRQQYLSSLKPLLFQVGAGSSMRGWAAVGSAGTSSQRF